VTPLCFAAARAAFRAGSDTPRDFLERGLAAIEAREPVVRAFVVLDSPGARRAADAATARYRAGAPLSAVDGLPIGIKDLIETLNMPTQMNSPAYAGWTSHRDAASVHALRKGGAVILGKTVTTEFGVGASGPTTNPHDPQRTPGGSSSGSAAAIAAGMIPAALGTQVMGSIIRPSSYCGCVGFKPSFNALNRGGIHSTVPSQGHLGLHAATLTDAWEISAFIAEHAGGDPGTAGLQGGPTLPAARKPQRLVRLRTAAWDEADAATRAVFDEYLDSLRREGVAILSAEDHPAIAAFEADFADWLTVYMDVVCWELRWPVEVYAARGADVVGERASGFLKHGLGMTRADYVRALSRRRAYAEAFARFADIAEAVIIPGSTGPAPVGLKFTGSPGFNALSSGLGGPAITLPLLAVEGLPLGVQIVGWKDRDAEAAAIAAWLEARGA